MRQRIRWGCDRGAAREGADGDDMRRRDSRLDAKRRRCLETETLGDGDAKRRHDRDGDA